MRLAIVHHHLNRGGVTSVIVNHLHSLATLPAERRPERVVVLYDGQHDGWPAGLPDAFPIELVVEPSLAYDPAGAKADPAGLAQTLATRLAACGLAPADTLLHTHNHALGKNAALPGALRRLADQGWRMLLQIHDFAEDNRPDNYRQLQEATGETDADRLGSLLYPQRQGVHYATLTERDADILRTAGVGDKRLHVLPNPAAEFGEMPPQVEARQRVFGALGLPPAARLIVYPVRGIRRKNLGEMLLLSALAPEGTYFAVTLRPKNPVEAASFDRWRLLAESLGLPCRFDIGSPREEGGYGCDFKDALAAADAVLTTSVAEGFGMVFLEAWLAGKPLIGRDLPEITREFKAAGMRFDGLVEAIFMPPPSRQRVEEMAETFRLIGANPSPIDPEQFEKNGDFGRTIPAVQELYIEEVTNYPNSAKASRAINAAAIDILENPPADHIDLNASIVRRLYSTEAIGAKLQQVYHAVWSNDGEVNSVSGRSIVEHFNHPDRCFPVRFETISDPDGNDELRELIAALAPRLEPQPTGEEPILKKLPGIRAVAFDVYGTLLVSASGDIALANESIRGVAALDALESVFATPDTPAAAARFVSDEIVKHLHAAIHAAHAESQSEHPEVDIVEIWKRVLAKLSIAGTEAQVRRLAVEFECRANPIGPMPGLAETLSGLHEAGLQVGVISNAQFFTPIAIEAMSGRSLEAWGFEAPHCHWSYRWGEAKPGRFLYEQCVNTFAKEGVAPEEVLYVGNDLRNDVWPAQSVGMRTALFAGDARSLRWRRDDQRLVDVRPDAVVTNLRQLLGIVL